MNIKLKNKFLYYNEYKIKCSVGKRGITSTKVEGDNKTPKGNFAFKEIFYRKDRISQIKASLKKVVIKKNMGWCDDVTSIYYNKEIKINKKIKHEKLFRKDNSYDYLIVINYNTKNIKYAKGSAIFLHLTKDYKKTAGCVAVKEKDLLIILKLITKSNKIKIY